MIKINSCNIHGFRGIRKSLSLPIDSGKSLLIYGDNGTGKSSISDTMEWFYFDKVEHLSSEEIGRKGVDALRNKFLPDAEEAFVDIAYTDSKLNTRKKLYIKNSKLQSTCTNSSVAFKNYMDASSKEKLILRYRDLITFILYTKKDKLDALSHIIGYSDVVKTRDTLKKAANSLKTEIKNKAYESRISQKQSLIIGQINQPIQTDEQYYQAITDLIKPLALTIEVRDDSTIDSVLNLIATPKSEAATLQVSYTKVINKLRNLKDEIGRICASYESYYAKYQLLLKDFEKFNKMTLEKLLSEGLLILERVPIQDDKCPLCLQPKKREDLIRELRTRIAELSTFKKEKEELAESRNHAQSQIQNGRIELMSLISEKSMAVAENAVAKGLIETVISLLAGAAEHIKSASLDKQTSLREPSELFKIEAEKIATVATELTQKMSRIAEENKLDIKFTIHTKINSIKEAYSEIKALRNEHSILKKHQQSLDVIYREFVVRQKVAFESFLKSISSDINRFYLFMNEAERVDEIELIPLEENEEFAGITFQFKFHGEVVSPPNKYLSESHLNCLGISLFLSTILAFNKINKFFVLDDVISSFDRHHRIRFANLLTEQFADYQILLFTHEKDWLNYTANMVKGKNWAIKRMCCDYDDGSFLAEPVGDLKERIEQKLRNSDPSDLGNMIRRYLEYVLKEVCLNLEVKVPFRYNENNERRMAAELLADLRGHLKKIKNDVNDKETLDRLSSSMFLGNIESHDSEFSISISDLKAFYEDVLSLVKYFFCGSCGKVVSLKNYDTVKKKVRCSCGSLKYSWER